MPYTINLHLLDNKQIKVDMGGIPLGNENSYRIYQGEENATQFTIASKPTKYENADYYIIFINSQNKRAFLDDIIPEPIPDDGQLLTSNTFTLPIGMAVKGYGSISIYAIYNNLETGKTEKVPFQTLKVKIWETIDTWKDYATDLTTPATKEWVENYVDTAMAEIDLSGYYTKTQTDGLLEEKQDKITNSNLLSADLVDSTNTTNKFVSAGEKAQIGTNATDITALQSDKLDKKPDGTTDLIDSNNKINIPYLPDFVVGQMLNAGVITSLDGETATAELTTGGKSKLGVLSNTLILTNDTATPTGYLANENNYYTIGDNTGVKDGEVLRDNNLNLLKNTYNGYLTPDYAYYHGVTASKGQGTGTILLNGTANGSGIYTIRLGYINIVNGTTYTLSLYSEIPSGVSGSYVILLLSGGGTTVAQTRANTLTVSFTATADINNVEILLFYYGGQTYDNYLVKPAIYEGDLTANMPEYQPYLSMFAGLYFEVGDWLVATASGWGKIDNVDAVKSVNGKTGFVELGINDISGLHEAIDSKQDKLTHSTDTTSTSKTLTLTANTRYALGTLSALDITFPATANDGDTIIIEFISGSTATVLTRDETNAIYNFNSVSADVFVEFNAEFKISVGKWVVYSAETTYTAV